MPDDKRLDMFFRQFKNVSDLQYIVISFLGEDFLLETPAPVFIKPAETSKLKKAFNKALAAVKMEPHSTVWFVREKIQYVIVHGLDEALVHPLMEKCSANIKNSICYAVTMASSDIIHDTQDLNLGISSVLNHAEYARFIQTRFDIINHVIEKNIQEELLVKYPFYKIDNYERSLMKAVFHGDFTQAKIITNYFLISHLRDIKTIKEIRMNVYNFMRLSVALAFKSPHMFNINNSYKEEIWSRVLKSEKLKDMQLVIDDFYDLLYDFVKPMKEFKAGNPKISSIINYIKKNYSNPLICEDQICEKFNISVSSLSHTFKEQVGMSFTAYIQARRIERAKHLIATTNDSIDDIAEKIGYSSGGSMFKMFKQIEGLSPSQFRRNYYEILNAESQPDN
ncbi:hypothetical protein FACS189476_00170 [Spirochaetia bacterium]|nr:hypothetical protein FACS189476_00170 [Spirochaetia bacterium]